MPTIQMLRDQKKAPSERKKERQKLYQRKDYRQFAEWTKRERIWCEDCKAEGLYTPATDLHHIISPFQGNLSEQEKIRLLMDPNNVKVLCNFCHRRQHGTASKQEIEEHNKKVKKVYDGLV